MKLYELAKQLGVKTADLIKIAKRSGMEKASNVLSLSDDQAKRIAESAKNLAPAVEPAPQKKVDPKPAAPAATPAPSPRKQPVRTVGVPLKAISKEEDRERLVGGRARALESYKARSQGRKPYVPPQPVSPRKPVTPPPPPPPPPAAPIAPAPVAEAPKPAPTPVVKPVAPPKPMVAEKPATPPPPAPAPIAEAPKPAPEKPAPAPVAEAPKVTPSPVTTAPASEKKPMPKNDDNPVEIDLRGLSGIGGFGGFGGGQSDGPSIVFHPADKYEDDFEENDRRGGRYDIDDSDDDLQREYFGRRNNGPSQQMKHHRDSSREENDRDNRRNSHSSQSSHGGNSARGGGQSPFGASARGGQQGRPGDNRGGQQDRRLGDRRDGRPGDNRNNPRDGRPGDNRGGQQGGRFGDRRDGRPGDNRNNPRDGRHGDNRGGQQGRPGTSARPQQQQPQNSVFPTRASAQSVFPTRPGASSVFPTRPGAMSVFPTRPNATPVNGRNPQPSFQQGQRSQQQGPGKNQRGQQPMKNNRNQQQQPQRPQKGKLPVAPPVQSNAAPTPVPIIVGDRDHVLTLRGGTLIRELAEMMDMRPNKLIADLMQQKMLVSINQRIDIETAGKIADKYGYRVELERTRRSTERKPEIKRLDEDDEIPEDKPEDMRPRPPVVTFMGHVDHGKTSLLDYIRKTKVTAGEAGGITQHIGAYSVDVNDRKITFLDTPGHAAFAAMRARGARLTDIAIIVVAADDGIMPQTREVIKDCRQSNVQIMVAINKCDLPSAKPDRVRQQLQGEGLTPEEWGGDIVCCEVSAHTGEGMDNLLEMILLQADVLELQSNPNRRADGYVIEAQMERGIGPTATLLVSSGTLNVGDVTLIDEHYGRIRALIDDRGNQVKSVGPAMAVRVMGLSGVPEAGAEFRVMKNEKRAKELAEKFAQDRKAKELQQAQRALNIDSLMDRLGEQNKKQLSIIVKADTQGTVEAIIDTLRDIRSEKITLDILGSAVGNISATDVQRAAAGKAMIVGFQVNTEAGVAPIATHDGVRISTFRIIYELFDFVKQSLLDLLDPEYKEVVKGHAQIRQIFDIGKLGKVAGCQLLDGVVRKDARVRIKRLREVLFDGKIASLKHFKDEVAEVHDLQEFGINFQDFENFAEGDVIECYAMEELERTL